MSILEVDAPVKWKKQGVIFEANNHFPWMTSQTGFPTPLLLKDRIRIFFSSYAETKQARIGYVDVERNNPSKIIQLSNQPVFELGEPGMFDDSGVNPAAVVWNGNDVYLYYQGWNPLKTSPHRLNVGLAISKDGGNTFTKYSPAPLFDRIREEPIFSCNPYVMKENDNVWHMWYMKVEQWRPIKDRLEATHTIYYAHSKDGIHWQRDNICCIKLRDEWECTSNATVIKEDGIYKMWYCYRSIVDFREGDGSYRIGYAESDDARNWTRMDDKMGLDVSPEGWDSHMQAFPAVLDVDGKRYLFYNGNGFGKTGIGYAIAE